MSVVLDERPMRREMGRPAKATDPDPRLMAFRRHGGHLFRVYPHHVEHFGPRGKIGFVEREFGYYTRPTGLDAEQCIDRLIRDLKL